MTTVAERLRAAAVMLGKESPAAPRPGTVLVINEGDSIPDGATVVTLEMRTIASHAMAVTAHGVFRSIERYLASGERDTSRCHYSINSRRVTHAVYERRLRINSQGDGVRE